MPLLLGAVAYTAWVLEVVLAAALGPRRAYRSELAAADQPLGSLFRATDLVAGLVVLAGSALELPLPPRRCRSTPARTALAVSSTAAMLAARTALVAFILAARRHGWWPPPHRAGPPLVPAEPAVTVWALSATAAIRTGRGTLSLVAGQRLLALLVAVWIGTLAVCVARRPAPGGAADGRRARGAAQSTPVRPPARAMPPREGCHPKLPPP
ncbi:hypothetical protein GCM10009753_13820 [Streptantibioticus ferralitis]|uniref:DUF998 domain-containing protein n=1 Tax=Streptantibioticus ferralitis TaxID=236510 RepID=A0ABT5Z845_9ACTN|nr:DUF998 domain-containing protein [Streptantibioticus ferralitis]